MLNSLYPKVYGAWAGNPGGQKPDYSRCCQEVRSSERWSRAFQCNRKRGYGPDEAYCKQHDPAVVKVREEAQTARSNAAWNKRCLEFAGPRFFKVLKEIAAGHNDAKALAQQTIDSYKELL